MSIIPSLTADVRGGCPTPSARRRSGVVRISGRDQVRVFGTHSLIRSERYALCRDLVDAMVHAAYSKTPEEFFPRLEKFHELLNGRFFLIGQGAMMVGFDDISNAIVDAARARAYIRIMPYSRRLALACRNALQDEFDRELNLREDQPSPA